MTTRLLLLFAACGLFALSACGDDADPLIENEEEVITAVTLTLFPNGTQEQVVLSFSDPDGSGPGAPITNQSGTLVANGSYRGQVSFNDGTMNIDAEILDEGTDHQVFYQADGGLNLEVEYADTDLLNRPLGLMTDMQFGDAGVGTLTVTLRHEPVKDPASAIDSPQTAGGATDVAVEWTLDVR